ncbi:hypothetical protein ACJMK2_030005 [Sinanodonta woodiana]|uniref:Uncharacterized protein n=1 Tax=Sinanodonta woodiana TaxID=1069815 RepID=A0ABD3XEB9_SINWO
MHKLTLLHTINLILTVHKLTMLHIYFKYDYIQSFRDYKEFACRGWNSHCAPWTNTPELGCCYSRGLSCKCNLWMHNCRCVTRLWGK